MTENCMDVLHTMPKNEALKKGAPCAKDAIESSGLLAKSCDLKWDKFWMSSKKFIAIHNIHGKDENEQEMHTRVSNELERQVKFEIMKT